MSFDKFDKRVKEAAEHQSVPFDEKSWNRMHDKLNEHLPEKKKDRRRFFFFLVLAALILGGSSLIIFNGKENIKPFAENGSSEKATDPLNPPGDTREKSPLQNEVPNNNVEPNTLNNGVSNNTTPQVVATNAPLIGATVLNKKTSLTDNGGASFRTRQGKLSNNTEVSVVNAEPKVQQATTSLTTTNDKPVQVPTGADQKLNGNVVMDNKEEEKKPAGEPQPKNETAVADVAKPGPPKKANKKVFPLAVSVSGGPDLSMVGVDNAGKIMLSYGAGLSYDLSPRFSVRTGFYVARKVYSAKPEDYNPPKEFWNYYPNLKNIDADCQIYEIPVIVDYFVGKKKNISLSAGVSSLIMKQEDYAYTYRPPYAQQDVIYSRTHKNENDHFFSIVHLSAGYNYPLGDRVSLRAEPYLKVPVGGIGYGKIKLNSAGLMMTLAVKPFTTNK